MYKSSVENLLPILIPSKRLFSSLFCKVEVVVEPLPGNNLLNAQAGSTICQRSKVEEAPDDHGQDSASSSPGCEKGLGTESFAHGPAAVLVGLFLGNAAAALGDFVQRRGLNVEDELDKGASNKSRSEVGG